MTGYQLVFLLVFYYLFGCAVVYIWCSLYKEDYAAIIYFNKGRKLRTMVGFLVYWPAIFGYMVGDAILFILRKRGSLR